MKPDGRPLFELNDYQRLMLKISALAPYNAVHAVKLKHDNIDDDLECAINQTITTIGIGKPQFSTDEREVYFNTINHPIQLNTITGSLQDHVNIEMNHRFNRDDLPLRFFIISTPTGHYFSVTYNHWIADAYGISRLVDTIFNVSCHNRRDASSSALTLSMPHMTSCFPSVYGIKAPFHRFIALIQSALRFSRAYRTPINGLAETDSGHTSYVFEPAVMMHLRRYSKKEGLTLNDLFLTVLAQLFGDLTQKQRSAIRQKRLKPKRDRIIIAVISNIRSQSRLPLGDVFSLFLGFFYLSFKSPEQVPFKTLSQYIRLQTQRLKHHRAALKQSLLFKIQTLFWDKKNNAQSQYRLFSKNTPITVGISNMDMRHTSATLNDSIEQYIRFSPTAMVCPIVFNLTTFNEHLSLGINFRKACYDIETVEQLQERFVLAIYELIAERENKIAPRNVDCRKYPISQMEY